MRRGTRNVLILQVILIVAVAIIMAQLRAGAGSGLAAGYGGGIALVNTGLLAWRSGRAGDQAGTGQGQWGAVGLLLGMVERFVFTLVAFGVGIGVLRLDPLALMMAFAAAQLGYLGAGLGPRRALPPE